MSEFMLWLNLGVAKGWISETVCTTHDTLPMTDEEWAMFEDGDDPCIFGVRVNGV